MNCDEIRRIEALHGVWIYELAELDGIQRRDAAELKAFGRLEDGGRTGQTAHVIVTVDPQAGFTSARHEHQR